MLGQHPETTHKAKAVVQKGKKKKEPNPSNVTLVSHEGVNFLLWLCFSFSLLFSVVAKFSHWPILILAFIIHLLLFEFCAYLFCSALLLFLCLFMHKIIYKMNDE